MCTSCNNPLHIDTDAAMDAFQNNLSEIERLVGVVETLSKKDQEFATSLITGFKNTYSLSPKQWHWVGVLADRGTDLEPIYGNFNAIKVAFRLAGEHIKFPKIRLLTAEDRYVQLNFSPEEDTIKVFVDGWSGHGYRKFAGVIEDNLIKPWASDRMSEDVKLAIQELALDPIGASKAMAARLGACIYCGKRLADPRSKEVGYGKTCAAHYGLPWGD